MANFNLNQGGESDPASQTSSDGMSQSAGELSYAVSGIVWPPRIESK